MQTCESFIGHNRPICPTKNWTLYFCQIMLFLVWGFQNQVFNETNFQEISMIWYQFAASQNFQLWHKLCWHLKRTIDRCLNELFPETIWLYFPSYFSFNDIQLVNDLKIAWTWVCPSPFWTDCSNIFFPLIYFYLTCFWN